MMKIFSPSEYKSQNPNAYLGDYLSYLEAIQKEAEETLLSAKDMCLSDSVIESIQKQSEEILEMSIIVEEYLGQIVLRSVDSLTLKELQGYFDFEAADKASNDKRAALETEKSEINVSLEKLDEEIANNLYENGRIKEFYQVPDVVQFFKDDESPSSYLEKLLVVLSNDAVFESCGDDLRHQLSIVLETECKIQNVNKSSLEKDELCERLMEFFKKVRNIVRYSSGAKEELARVVLSDSGIKQLLPREFDENTTNFLVIDLMNLRKFSTEFYSKLPDTLKESLATARLQGEPYMALIRTYWAFLKGEELPYLDLNQNERSEKSRLSARLEQIGAELADLEKEKKARTEFLNDEYAMRESLKKTILDSDVCGTSAKDIDLVIGAEEIRLAKLKSDLKEASSLLSIKEKDLETARAILVDPNYHCFFQAVELNNVRRVYRLFGVEVTEEVIVPFLQEEKRRLEQFDIMVTLQDRLSTLHEKIERKKFLKYVPFYKGNLGELNDEYQNAIKYAFSALKQKGLFYVDVPQISGDSTVGNVIVLPSEIHPEPKDFSGVRGLKQTFWNMSTGIDDKTKRKILSKNPGYDSWEDYYRCLMADQERYVSKLFDFEIGADGYYTFASTKDEREKLLQIQRTIIDILSSVYNERAAFRQSLGECYTPLDSDKVTVLENFLGKGANLSRENLANYIEQTETKVAEFRDLLAKNYGICSKLGIEVYSESVSSDDDLREDEVTELDEKIRSLHIDGVTNFEEAVARRDLLLGVEGYTVPESEVKQFYLKCKKN